jgi:peptidoglycan/xylan/chitin deacetylase (PgdA/CDA1 family)
VNATEDRPGAFVVSLDFEIHWGVRDVAPADGPYRRNLLGVRQAIPRMLELFEEYDVAATWATVGFLFARDEEELKAMSPGLRPRYENRALDPYAEEVGTDEGDDPLHYGSSLLKLIRAAPRQEIASHTFSHYYCREPGQTKATFEADLAAAVEIAAARGITLKSLVVPRNQVNPEYLEALPRHGFTSYRSNPERALHADPWLQGGIVKRAARLLDNYVPVAPKNLASWDDVRVDDKLCRVPASFFLQPYTPSRARFDGARAARLVGAARHAAKRGEIFHLWWHPHNFGTHLDENIAFLRKVLEGFRVLRDSQGMRSVTMAEVADHVLGVAPLAG